MPWAGPPLWVSPMWWRTGRALRGGTPATRRSSKRSPASCLACAPPAPRKKRRNATATEGQNPGGRPMNPRDSTAVGRPVRVAHALRNAAALGDLVPVAERPVTNRLVLVATSGRATGGDGADMPGATTRYATADAGSRVDERVQSFTQLSGIPLGKVDRVTDAVEGELDRAVRLLSVQIVDESGDYLPRHNDSRSLRRTAPSVTAEPTQSQLFPRFLQFFFDPAARAPEEMTPAHSGQCGGWTQKYGVATGAARTLGSSPWRRSGPPGTSNAGRPSPGMRQRWRPVAPRRRNGPAPCCPTSSPGRRSAGWSRPCCARAPSTAGRRTRPGCAAGI